MPQVRIGLDPTGRLVSIDDGKLNIHENEIGALRRRHGNAFLSVDRLDDFEAGIGKQIVENPPIVLGVLDDQYALAHAACLWSVARSGKTILKVEPTPGVDSRSIWPPCTLIRRRAIDNPSPVPPFCRVMLLSTC